MIKKAFLSAILFCAAVSFASKPAYVRHDYIKGSTLIMTNIEDYVSGVVTGDTSVLEAKINTVAECATNYSDTVGVRTASLANGYTDEVSSRIAESATNYVDSSLSSLRRDVSTLVSSASIDSTNYTDSATGEVYVASTKYTDEETGKVYAASTNYIEEAVGKLKVSNAAATVSEEAEARGVTFENKGLDQNTAIEIGKGAKSGISDEAIEGAPSNTVLRSVAVAIGGCADATDHSSPLKSQGIAIGWFAQAIANNAISIGSGAQHTNETIETGNATVASGQTAISIGYDAKSTALSTIAIGRSAKATAPSAVQLGQGVNTNANSFQVGNYQILDSKGQIPTDRLQSAASVLEELFLAGIDRAIRPGNMTIVPMEDEQTLEPRLDGMSEILFDKGTNEYWRAGAEIGVDPPLGTRNYDMIISDIPQAYGVTNGVPYPIEEQDNFCLTFELPSSYNVSMSVSPSLGYLSGSSISLTNAPCIIKVREPSTNRVYIVVKPWDPMDI